MIVDTFAGPGGWDEGLRMIGRTDVVGLEWDKAACQTAKAAGHQRIRSNVAAYPTDPFTQGIVEGKISSPPCQAWSMAGKRKGELDRENGIVIRPKPERGPQAALVALPPWAHANWDTPGHASLWLTGHSQHIESMARAYIEWCRSSPVQGVLDFGGEAS